MNVFFTLPHNQPSGGVKVVNEYCQLLNQSDIPSFVCLPNSQLKRATFLPNPAPVISLESMVSRSTEQDIIIMCWQSEEEYAAFKTAKALKKIFWQHGILTPVGKGNVGDLVLKEKVFNEYWNVSKACGDFLSSTYGINQYKILSPFLTFDSEVKFNEARNGFLTLARRGSSQIESIKKLLKQYNQSLTVLEGNFANDHFLNLLRCHKFFISLDNGIKSSGALRRFKPKKWKLYSKNFLGFPVPPLEAMGCGALTIGYAMGGGLEYMNSRNCFLASDDNPDDLHQKLHEAIHSSASSQEKMLKNARKSIQSFTAETSLYQIKKHLNID